ncbi:hypothetical protein AAFF_G00117280 [Aldrovandia affinis]|uniref:non-specific serine/threonine protein kinase n=1 Tax=Aldrovandia affinis TaxID=143900 RepID=A0AAD7T2U1_9TELE|nr:hypothetical protein AAFF_G00117280 [Aldrovandia affinis]
MELCEMGTLRTWIDERPEHDTQRSSDALGILQQVVEGVKYMHSKNLIHRDLKPVNILFGGEGRVKIGDFGLVTSAECDSDEGLLERTKRTGTRIYMSPEQMNQRKYDKEVDVFALGLIYFELLWNMTTKNEKAKIWNDVRRNTFPPQFYVKHSVEHKLIERMLSEEPRNRPDASMIAAELAKYSTNLGKCQHTLQEMKTI